MIINIRGTNGSGKSTVARALMVMSRPPAQPLYGFLGPRRPEAYHLCLPEVRRDAYLLGPYDVETGGCDSVQPFSLILDLLGKYTPRGHVIFEGSLVSDHYGKVGKFLEQHGKAAVLAFMPASLEECLRRVGVRRAGKGNEKALNPANTSRRYESIQRLRARVEELGRLEVVTLDEARAPDQIREMLS